MSGFMYFACVLTGVLSGGALGMVAASLLTRAPTGRWTGAVIGAAILTWYLLKLGRKIQKVLHEK
jgi:ABC-type cobalamin transport system permease subunit